MCISQRNCRPWLIAQEGPGTQDRRDPEDAEPGWAGGAWGLTGTLLPRQHSSETQDWTSRQGCLGPVRAAGWNASRCSACVSGRSSSGAAGTPVGCIPETGPARSSGLCVHRCCQTVFENLLPFLILPHFLTHTFMTKYKKVSFILEFSCSAV